MKINIVNVCDTSIEYRQPRVGKLCIRTRTSCSRFERSDLSESIIESRIEMHYLLNNWRVALACVRDKVGNGATYGGEILHADSCGACEGHGLGLMSMGVVIGKKIVL